jgi:hypothetical protein
MKYIILNTFLLLNIACNSGFSSDIDMVKQVRNVDKFNKINLAVSGELYLIQGNETRVEVEADIKKIDFIITEVTDGKLKIRKKEPWPRLGKVRIYITTPDVNELIVSGSGKIIANSEIKTQDLNSKVSGSGSLQLSDVIVKNNLFLEVTGSGSIHINGYTNNNHLGSFVSGSGKIIVNQDSSEDLNCKVTGSGNVLIAGKKTRTASIEITGSGNFNAEDLPIDSVKIKVTGSGGVKVNAVETLTTKITGSGNVRYKGNPRVNAYSTGSGKTKSLGI